MNNKVDKEKFLNSVLSEGREGYADFVAARQKETKPTNNQLGKIEVEASQEKKVDVAELMKFDELMGAVDKFEELAKETKKAEKELQEAVGDREEHLSSTQSLGKTVLADHRRERGLVTLKADVGQKLEEMIAIKGDILDKLSDVKSHELRAKIYERFERKKPDEVGMSSEVKLETKSDKHADDLKQRALHHRVTDIVGPNLVRINKRKAEAKKIAAEPVSKNVEPVAEEDLTNVSKEIEKKREDHLAPGIQIGEAADLKTPEPRIDSENIAVEKPKDVIAEPTSESKPNNVAETENQSEVVDKQPDLPVEIMEIDSNGEPVNVTNNEGGFQEDKVVSDLSEDSRLLSSSLSDEAQASESNDGNDKIKAEVDEVKGKIKTIKGRIDEMRPEEPVRNIENFVPPTSRIDQAAKATGQDLNKPQPVVELAKPIEEAKPVAEINPLPELSVQPEVQPEPIISEQKIEPVQPVVEGVGNNTDANNNVIDIKPAIEARDVQAEQPVQEQKRRFFGKLFGGNNADRHGAERITKQKEVTAGDIHQILNTNEEEEAA